MSSSLGQGRPAWCWPCGWPVWACEFASSTRPRSRGRLLVHLPCRHEHSSSIARSILRMRSSLAGGRWAPSISGRTAGRSRTPFSRDIGAGISPFPFALIFPQDEHERLLIDRLREAGVEVERQTAVVEFEATEGRVVARLESADGVTRTCEAFYIAGCDGARSTVRPRWALVSGRHLRTSLLRRRRQRAWPGDERRAARRPGYQRLSCGVSR